MFALRILSPNGTIFDDTVNEVTLPTEQGEITVLPHHAPIFSKLTEGILTIKKNNKETLLAIVGGFLEVGNNKVKILSDYAIESSSIQIAKAQEAKKKAEDLMKNKKDNEDFTLIEKDLQRSLLELKVADKIKKRS